MAGLSPKNNGYRIKYRLPVRGKKDKNPYEKFRTNKLEAEKIKREVEELCDSADLKVARADQIEYWINQKYITPDHAEFLFPGFTAPKSHYKESDKVVYTKLRTHFSKHYTAKAKPKHHNGMMNQLDKIFDWMKKHVDDLSDLNEGHAHDFLDYITNHAEQDRAYNVTQPDGTVSKMKRVGYAPGATRVFMLQFHAIARVLVTGHCCSENQRPPCKPSAELKGILSSYDGKRINTSSRDRQTHAPSLHQDVVDWMLTESLKEKLLLGGAFPVAIYLGRYLGPRDEEVAYLQWDHIASDFTRTGNDGSTKFGKINIRGDWCPYKNPKKETPPGVTNLNNEPSWNGSKTGDFRELDIHHSAYPILKKEYERQCDVFGFSTEKLGRRTIKIPNCPYVIPSTKWDKGSNGVLADSRVLNRKGPIYPSQINKAMKLFLQRNNQIVFTYYSWRHTFATHYIRDGGKPIALMILMGHKRFETTLKYVNANEVSSDPINDILDSAPT